MYKPRVYIFAIFNSRDHTSNSITNSYRFKNNLIDHFAVVLPASRSHNTPNISEMERNVASNDPTQAYHVCRLTCNHMVIG